MYESFVSAHVSCTLIFLNCLLGRGRANSKILPQFGRVFDHRACIFGLLARAVIPSVCLVGLLGRAVIPCAHSSVVHCCASFSGRHLSIKHALRVSAQICIGRVHLHWHVSRGPRRVCLIHGGDRLEAQPCLVGTRARIARLCAYAFGWHTILRVCRCQWKFSTVKF